MHTRCQYDEYYCEYYVYIFFCVVVFVCAHMHVFVQMSSMLFLVVRQCFSVLV